jgi:hypothetical protein
MRLAGFDAQVEIRLAWFERAQHKKESAPVTLSRDLP